MVSKWQLLDAHQMGRRVHTGVPDKDGKGYHGKDTHDIVACREMSDGGIQLGVWSVAGVIVTAPDLVSGTNREVIRILNADQGTRVERVRDRVDDGLDLVKSVR